jgi:hypothetical protein
MKRVSSLLVIFLISCNAFGADNVERRLAIEYLRLARYEQIINSTIDSYSQQLFKEMSGEDRVKFKKVLTDTMGWESTKHQLAELVIKIYTRDELNAAIAFMKSRLGASMTAKGDRFAALMTVEISNNLQKFMQDHLPLQTR